MLTIFLVLFLYACVQEWLHGKKKKPPQVPCFIFIVTADNYVWCAFWFVLVILVVASIIIWRALREDKKRKEDDNDDYATFI